MKQAKLDHELVVVGGGIHGAGVAQAAAARGQDVLLLEEQALASGTSSRSSKLIHGGLRYLESGDLRLVRESLSERAILLRVAPHLVRLVPFHVPVYRDTSRGPFTMRIGLSLYALLGNLRRTARFTSLPRGEWDGLDGLETSGLRAVFRYHDGQTDDALLTRAVVASAVELGATLEVPASLLEARREESGYLLRYRAGEEEREVRAAAWVNAAGPWIEHVRDLVHPRPDGMDVDLVGGTHVELPGTLERGIYYTEAPRDRRAVFHMPWKDRILVGTTEHTWRGDPRAVAPTEDEVEYLVETFSHYFPGRETRVLDSWAGLRVLPSAEGAAFSRSRETSLLVDDHEYPRYLGIYGGKLTGYRATAERVLDRLAGSLPVQPRRADTATLPLPDPRTAEAESGDVQ